MKYFFLSVLAVLLLSLAGCIIVSPGRWMQDQPQHIQRRNIPHQDDQEARRSDPSAPSNSRSGIPENNASGPSEPEKPSRSPVKSQQ